MKTVKAVLVLALLAVLGGCAVYPVGPYYGPHGYYHPAPGYYGWH